MANSYWSKLIYLMIILLYLVTLQTLIRQMSHILWQIRCMTHSLWLIIIQSEMPFDRWKVFDCNKGITCGEKPPTKKMSFYSTKQMIDFGEKLTRRYFNLETLLTWKHDYWVGNKMEFGNIAILLQTSLRTWKRHFEFGNINLSLETSRLTS